jgi:dimethylargininase
MDLAITRAIPRSLERCELTHLDRQPISHERAVQQHQAYCDALTALGLTLIQLPADEAHPDCCFVEDTAVVLPEVAVLASLGAASRRGELPAIAQTLARYRPLHPIELPATLEGGDVLLLGKSLFVGRTTRTNDAGIAALAAAVARWGYQVVPVPVFDCLHLKSAVTALDEKTVLANPAYFDRAPFRGLGILEVDPEEPGAANVLAVRGKLLAHPGYPRTLERLVRAGYEVTPVDISEFLKAEAALTCKSLLL